MNKLINRISPETSENRILHAGFSIILMSEEITQTLSGLSSDMIIFILSGSITIYSTKEEKKTIGEQYMIFLRSFENYTYDITLGSKIIIFFFDSLTMNELPYYQHPYGILPQPISKWIELKIVEPLYGFLELVGQYLENNFLNYPLYELKRNDIADNLLYFARGYLIHNLDAYTFHIAVFAIEAEGKETYFPETR